MKTRIPLLLIVSLSFFLLPFSSGATLLQTDLFMSSDGLLTRDTSTGLEWLDITESTNRSFQDVSGQFGTGGDFEGFRYATAPEVATFFTNAGITDTSGAYSSADVVAINLLIDLVGDTRLGIGLFGERLAQGLTSTVGTLIGPTNHHDPFVQTYAEDGGESTGLAGLGRAIVFQDIGTAPTNSNPNFGSWLVRTTPTVVLIDIKPGSDPNSINLGAGGTVPVAIFSTTAFDATTVDPTTVTLAGANVALKGKGTSMASFEDVDRDGLLDLVVHVSPDALELSETDTEAVLEGQTFDGRSIRGVDLVRIVP